MRYFKLWKSSNTLVLKFILVIVEMNVLPPLKVGKEHIIHLRAHAKMKKTKCWVLKKYVFDTLVNTIVLFGVDVWGTTSVSSLQHS